MSNAKSRWNTTDELPDRRRSKIAPEVYRVLADKALMLALYERYSLDGMAQVTGVARSTVQRYLIAHKAEFRTTRQRAPLRDKPLPVGMEMPDQVSGRSPRQQIVISLQRAYVLGDRCARPHCQLSCDPIEDDCHLEQILQDSGDLDRRPWEPEDHREYWAKRVWSENGGRR